MGRGGGGGVGNGGKSDLFGNTSAAVDLYKFKMGSNEHRNVIIRLLSRKTSRRSGKRPCVQ